ncbi:MAG: hypothetical protein HYX93_04240 [Chloroflexi bacterium]|nr:hypothetical protein [Chloroflexota bacterium]
MKHTGSGWLKGRRFHSRLLLLTGLALLLAAVSCNDSLSPEDVVNLYLSEVNQGDRDDALQRWETSEVGPSPVALDPEQERVRLEGRREVAEELTQALVVAGQRLRWERVGASYYDLQDNIPSVREDPTDADLATIEMRLIVEGREGASLEESIAFNLWRVPEIGWHIMGLDKGLSVLEPFLNRLREMD